MSTQQTRIGKFFLEQRGKNGLYSICWYEAGTKQRRATGTADPQEAGDALCQHNLRQSKPQNAKDSTLFTELERYWELYAKTITSRGVQKNATDNAIEVWPNDINIRDITAQEQQTFVKKMRAKKLADSTIDRRLGCLWNALNWSARGNYIEYVPPQIKAADWNANLEAEAKCFSLPDIIELFKACGPASTNEHSEISREHWWRFLVLAIGTAGRECAVRTLTWPQLVNGNGSRYIRLNPAGRKQTKKRRATVPMGDVLATEIASWSHCDMRVITRCSKPLKSPKFFVLLAKTAGVSGKANAIRHFIRTWLAERGVNDAEADIFVGHAEEGSATGRRHYKHLRPDYLQHCAKSIDELFRLIAPHLQRPIGGLSQLEDQPDPLTFDLPVRFFAPDEPRTSQVKI